MGCWARLTACAAVVLAVAFAAGACPAARAAGGLTLLTDQPLPMAVRDGGVAEVTVRSVPFALASATLDAPTAAALDAYLAAVATDCFLFAQAVGHVRPGADGDGDTLTAHRLARARSDTVTAALLKAGLPADSVTGVWDRQFAAREPRVTLWVFARPAGDDCAGTALPGAVAQVAVVPARAASAPARRPPRPGRASSLPPGSIFPNPARLPAGRPASRRCACPWRRRRHEPLRNGSEVDEIRADAGHAATQAAIAPFERSPVMRMAVPSTERGSGDAGGHECRGRPEQTAGACAARDRCRRRRLAHHPGCTGHGGGCRAKGRALGRECPRRQGARRSRLPRVEIVFEPDSSYLANGAAAQLESLLASLPRDATWEVELQAAVDDAAGSLPPDKALAYNQWLAERRQSRVEDWLGTRPGAPVLRVRRSVLPHDPSRRVVISARPLP